MPKNQSDQHDRLPTTNQVPDTTEQHSLVARRSEPFQPIFVVCDTYQACYLNLRLPAGLRLELEDVVIKATQLRLQKQKKEKAVKSTALTKQTT
jgi:hypothetical protein